MAAGYISDEAKSKFNLWTILLTIGISGTAGSDLNMVTAILPTLLMVVGILDLVHFVDAYDEAHLTTRGPKKLLYTTIAAVAIPCAFNSITDIAGFMSLAAAPMSAIRDFGWLAGVGLALLYLVLMVCVVRSLDNPTYGSPDAHDRS